MKYEIFISMMSENTIWKKQVETSSSKDDLKESNIKENQWSWSVSSIDDIWDVAIKSFVEKACFRKYVLFPNNFANRNYFIDWWNRLQKKVLSMNSYKNIC